MSIVSDVLAVLDKAGWAACFTLAAALAGAAIRDWWRGGEVK